MSAEETASVEVAQPPAPPLTEETAEAVPVAQNGGGPPRRVRLNEQQLQAASKEEIVGHWGEQDTYIDTLETQATTHDGELTGLRDSLERMKQQHAESQHREKVLVRRLASKEQEMQDYASQLAELRAAQVPSAAALRSALLDPAASLLVQKLRQELAAIKTRLEETQNELSAWKFTPDSNTGKRLMAKCRLLYQENEELGRVISSGRLAKLEGELALQKSFSDEVKKSQSELDEFLQELDEDVEGMQGTIYFLQQQLKSAKETVATLTQENHVLRQSQQGEEGDEVEKEGRWGEEGTTQDSTPGPIDDEGSSQLAEHDDEPMEESCDKQTQEDNPTPDEGPSPTTSPAPVVAEEDDTPPSKRSRLDSEDQTEEDATE